MCRIGREIGKVPVSCLFRCSDNPSCMEKHKMTSTNNMLKQVQGLVGTSDLNKWEESFVISVWEASKQGTRPDLLSENRVEKLEEIWNKHFAG